MRIGAKVKVNAKRFNGQVGKVVNFLDFMACPWFVLFDGDEVEGEGEWFCARELELLETDTAEERATDDGTESFSLLLDAQ